MTSKARNWRLWKIPTSGSMYAIPGLAYTTVEAAEGSGALVSDRQGRMEQDRGSADDSVVGECWAVWYGKHGRYHRAPEPEVSMLTKR